MSIKLAVGILITLIYLAVGFYPFNWVKTHRFNNEWTELTADGFSFSRPGIAFSDTSPEWVQKAVDGSRLEIDLEIRAAHPQQFGPARIFTLSENSYLRNLTIAQEGEDLVVRMRNPETGLNGLPPYVVKKVFSSSAWHRIKVSFKMSALTILVDESTPLHVTLPEKPFSQWDLNYKIALGNEQTFDRPWLGFIRRATVRTGEESIAYTLPGCLNVPDNYEVPRKPRSLLQAMVAGSGTGDAFDHLINLFGFIPYGFMIIYLTSGRSWVVAGSLCLVLSLAIETGQLLVVTDRVPSLADLALNTFGGMFGAWVGEKSLSRRYSHSRAK